MTDAYGQIAQYSRWYVPQQNQREGSSGGSTTTAESKERERINSVFGKHESIKRVFAAESEDKEKKERERINTYASMRQGFANMETHLQKLAQTSEEHFRKIDEAHSEQNDKTNVCQSDCLKILQSMEEHNQKMVEHLELIAEVNRPKLKQKCRPLSEVASQGKNPNINPTVEVSTRILDIPKVKIDEQLCTIDLLVCIDWVVDKSEDCPAGHFPPGPHQDWTERDWGKAKFFNPGIKMMNALPVDLDISEGQVPRCDRVDAHGNPTEEVDAHGKRTVWLKKTMRFCGEVMLPTSSDAMTKFPFDIHRIALRMQGDDKLSKLALPKHRKESQLHHRYKEVAQKDPRRIGEGQLLAPTAFNHLTGLGYDFLGIRVQDKILDEDTVDATSVANHEKTRDRQDNDPFVVELIIARKTFSSYLMEIGIMQLMVVLAATSLYDVAELSGRLSISMTILLTMAAYTTTKPVPIAQCESPTFHDIMERRCLVLVVFLCFANVVSSQLCGGEDEESPAFLRELYHGRTDPDYLCSLDWCRSRKIDCYFLMAFGAIFLLIGPLSVVWMYCDFRFRKHKRNVRFDQRKKAEFQDLTKMYSKMQNSNWHAKNPRVGKLACRCWCFLNGQELHCSIYERPYSRASVANESMSSGAG